MKIDNILGKIIALTKEVHFQEPKGGFDSKIEFLISKEPFFFSGGVVLEWWYTKPANIICEDIAIMATSYNSSLKVVDQKTFCSTIMKTLQENALNHEFFDGDLIFFRRVKTLFDARILEDVHEFALRLWKLINHSLAKTITDWLVLYPLPLINAPSFDLGFDGLLLLRVDDKEAWEKLALKYKNVQYWNPLTGKFKDGIGCNPSQLWLACEVKGTASGSRINAGLKMRTFLAVLFSHLSSKRKNLLTKSMLQTSSNSIQFSAEPAKVGCVQMLASIGTLLHPLIDAVNVSSDIMSEILNWYQLRSSAQPDKVYRVTKGSHFINYGMIADNNIEQFIHFFIALDALFGERNKVEDSIVSGIKKIFPNNTKWDIRAKKLFELRSELVHGGASSIDEWNNLAYYRRNFYSDPLYDVGLAVMTALRMYFTL